MAQVAAQDIFESIKAITVEGGLAHGTIWEDTGVQLMARVQRADNTPLLIAETASITCKVFNLDTITPGTAVASPAVVVATAMNDTLQTTALDPRWDADSTGYNFRHTIPASAFPTGNARYRIEYEFDPATAGEENFMLIFELSVCERYSG